MYTKKATINTEFEEAMQCAIAILDEPIQDIEFDLSDLDIDFGIGYEPFTRSSPAVSPIVCTTRTSKISIRVPSKVLAAFKERAKNTRTGYQTLINESLKASAKDWAFT